MLYNMLKNYLCSLLMNKIMTALEVARMCDNIFPDILAGEVTAQILIQLCTCTLSFEQRMLKSGKGNSKYNGAE